MFNEETNKRGPSGKQNMDPIIGPLMREEIQKAHPREDYVINEHYMCIGGLLYFKCEDCKCWCIYEDQHEHGYRVCSFCEKLYEEQLKQAGLCSCKNCSGNCGCDNK